MVYGISVMNKMNMFMFTDSRFYLVPYRLNTNPFNSSREVQSHLVESSNITSILFGAGQLMAPFLRSEILPSDKRVFISICMVSIFL